MRAVGLAALIAVASVFGQVPGVQNSYGESGGRPWGRVNAFALDPLTTSIVYAGTDIGVFKSSNAGNSWIAIDSGLPNVAVHSLAIDPSAPATLYAGTDSGVFKSSNAGNSWTAVNSGLPNIALHSLAVDPSAPGTLYAGIFESGVFKSSNAGTSWVAANSGLPNTTVQSKTVVTLAIDPSAPANLYAGTQGGGVFKSSNAGASWSAVNSGFPLTTVLALGIDPSAPATLYAGTPTGVFKSSNSGASWSAVNSGLRNTIVRALAIDPSASATLYAGTDGGVFKSSNAGNSWIGIDSGLPNVAVHSLAIDPSAPATLYAGTDDGVFKSSSAAAIWQPIGGNVNNGAAPAGMLPKDASQTSLLEYGGFRINISNVQLAGTRNTILNALRMQIDRVNEVKVPKDTSDFFKSVKVTVATPEDLTRNSSYSSVTKTLTLRDEVWITAADGPVLLHELIHAYHDQRLQDGFGNADILRLYRQASSGKLFPSDSYMMRNPTEYLAQMVVIYLRGRGGRDPLTRENIMIKQPDCYRWLEKEFGPR